MEVEKKDVLLQFVKDGEKVVGAFCGEPHVREVFWNGRFHEIFDPEKAAQYKVTKPALKISLNFYVPAIKVGNPMKVIEVGPACFKDISKCRDKYGTDKWLFEIVRHEKKRDKRTFYSVLPEEKIDDELRAKIANTPLHDLGNLK